MSRGTDHVVDWTKTQDLNQGVIHALCGAQVRLDNTPEWYEIPELVDCEECTAIGGPMRWP